MSSFNRSSVNICILLPIIMVSNYDLTQFNVQTAFLHESLDEECI
jgi:hypothetical protein